MSNVYYKDGNYYSWGPNAGTLAMSNGIMGHGIGSFLQNPKLASVNLQNGLLQQIGGPATQQQTVAPAQNSNTSSLNAQYNRLTGQASDALYGGLLGYNPKPMMSAAGQSFAPPDPSQGFRFPFGLLRGGY